MKSNILAIYKQLDKAFNTHVDNSFEFLVNFSKTRDLPIHRWYYYVEGYSPLLVTKMINHLHLKNEESVILDPFTGSGTTLLGAKNLGIASYGFEVNPFSAFMSKVKSRNYSKDDVDAIVKFKLPKYQEIDDVYGKYELRIIENLFDREKLVKIENLKREVNKVENQKIKDLLFFAILSTLPDVSNYRKGGNGLKRKTVVLDKDPFIEFQKKLVAISQDLLKYSMIGPEPIIENDSCLNIENYNIPSISLSLFSPPYANCFDPFEVYKIELWVGEFVDSYLDLRQKRRAGLSSNLNANIDIPVHKIYHNETLSSILAYLQEQPLWDKKIPKMLSTYFSQMHFLLEKIYEKTIKGGHCVIVVGNSAYGQIALPTDIILGEIGNEIGFNVEEIIEARKNETSSQQHSKLGEHIDFVRESIVVLQK
jgi:hypothetical protein